MIRRCRSLIKAAIDSNRDLLAAASRMEEAMAFSGAVKANMYPHLSYQAAAGGGKAGSDATEGKWWCGRRTS